MCDEIHNFFDILGVFENILNVEESEREFVQKNATKLKCFYNDMRYTATSLDMLADMVAEKAYTSYPCEESRQALERCYACHPGESLRCRRAVRRLVMCARAESKKRLQHA